MVSIFPTSTFNLKKKKRSVREVGQGGEEKKKVRKKDKKIPHRSPESVSSAFKIIKAPLK